MFEMKQFMPTYNVLKNGPPYAFKHSHRLRVVVRYFSRFTSTEENTLARGGSQIYSSVQESEDATSREADGKEEVETSSRLASKSSSWLFLFSSGRPRFFIRIHPFTIPLFTLGFPNIREFGLIIHGKPERKTPGGHPRLVS